MQIGNIRASYPPVLQLTTGQPVIAYDAHGAGQQGQQCQRTTTRKHEIDFQHNVTLFASAGENVYCASQGLETRLQMIVRIQCLIQKRPQLLRRCFTTVGNKWCQAKKNRSQFIL